MSTPISFFASRTLFTVWTQKRTGAFLSEDTRHPFSCLSFMCGFRCIGTSVLPRSSKAVHRRPDFTFSAVKGNNVRICIVTGCIPHFKDHRVAAIKQLSLSKVSAVTVSSSSAASSPPQATRDRHMNWRSHKNSRSAPPCTSTTGAPTRKYPRQSSP